MGGTELCDQNINRHRVNIRSKKWWCGIFTWLLDASAQNAWTLYRQVHPQEKVTQLTFRRTIVLHYLRTFAEPYDRVGRPRSRLGEREVRFDTIGHLVRQTQNGARRRCVGLNCTARVRTECMKCEVGLCITCFATYHTE